MSPIIGVIDSAKTGRISTGSYESIQTVTVGAGGQSTISFTSIPQTYKHLEIRCIGKLNSLSGTDISHYITFNSDTTSSYVWDNANGYNSTASIGGATTLTNTGINYAAFPTSASALANYFGGVICTILDYTNTNKYTTVHSLVGDSSTTYGNVDFKGGFWANTSAVTRIDLTVGYNLVQYSSFALYGIKG